MKFQLLIILFFGAVNTFAQPKTTNDIEVKYNHQKGTTETKLVTKKVSETSKPTNNNSSGSTKNTSSTPNHFKPAYSDIEDYNTVKQRLEKINKDEKDRKAYLEADKREREQLAKSYPDRVIKLKAEIAKAQILITPNNWDVLTNLARKNNFTDKEAWEIFPFDSYVWEKRPQVYQDAFPIAQVYLDMKKAAAEANNLRMAKEAKLRAAENEAKIKADAESGRDLIAFRENGKIGLRNKHNKMILKPTYDSIGYFHDGLATVHSNGKAGVINKLGEEKIAPQYKKASIGKRNFITMLKGKKYGAIDTLNNILIAFEFDYLSPLFYYADLITATKGKKEGLFNALGDVVLPIEYDNLHHESSLKIFTTKKDKKEGLINYDGKIIAPTIYEELKGIYKDKLYKVKRNGKWGYISSVTGSEVIPIIYDLLDDFAYHSKTLRGTRNGVTYDINENAEEKKVGPVWGSY